MTSPLPSSRPPRRRRPHPTSPRSFRSSLTTPGVRPSQVSISSHPLGRGSFGSVWRGAFSGCPVAIKVCAVSNSSPAAAIQFRREMTRYQQLRHPCITQFFCVVQHQTTGDLLLVTELMKGGSLYHALERLRTLGVQQLPHQSLLRISQHITNGLSYLHASDFSFGDLKSMNVLLSEPPDHTRATFSPAVQAKLCDFGLSRNLKHLVSPDSKHGPNETHIPARHGPAGTFAYLAPEAFSGLPVDDADAPKAADIYALGIVLWELATLKRPWPGRQPLQLIRLVKKEARRPDWPHDVSSLPHGFVDMVEKCWSQDPRLRPTAEDVSAMLDGMQQRVSGSCSSTQWSFSRESLLSRTTDDVDETSLSVDLGAVHVDDEYDRSHHGPTDFCGGDVDDFGLFEPPTIRHVRSVKVLPFEDLASDISGVTSAIQTTSNSNSRFSMDSFSQESVRKESSLDSRSRNYRVPWNASEQMANADNMLRSFEEEDLNVDNIGISLYTRPHFR